MGAGKTVYVVDDEVLILTFVKEALEEAGFKVQTFHCPENALAALSGDDKVPVLLITDFTMPQFNGGELIRRTLKFLPKLKTLLISGNLPVKDFEIAIRSADIFLKKPFELDDLIDCVKRVLKG